MKQHAQHPPRTAPQSAPDLRCCRPSGSVHSARCVLRRSQGECDAALGRESHRPRRRRDGRDQGPHSRRRRRGAEHAAAVGRGGGGGARCDGERGRSGEAGRAPAVLPGTATLRPRTPSALWPTKVCVSTGTAADQGLGRASSRLTCISLGVGVLAEEIFTVRQSHLAAKLKDKTVPDEVPSPRAPPKSTNQQINKSYDPGCSPSQCFMCM